MGKLIYPGILSLDGYVADRDGNFDWSVPDIEVHAHVNEIERSVGTYLYGRRIYEVMRVWEEIDAEGDSPPVERQFARMWQSADKIVYSTTLDEVTTERTRLERDFDPATVRKLKANTEADISVSGPNLAAHAIRAGLVDEYQLYVSPVAVGGGKRFLPDDVRLDLELLDERPFGNGVVHLRYRTRGK